MDYKYDVFISYKKSDLAKFWITTYFAPCLERELGEELGRKAHIYFDEEDLKSGQSWPDALKNALTLSRCLVPVFSGLYFSSEWCSREFAIIHHRQKNHGLGCLSEPTGIIVPIKVNDGDHIPNLAKNIQSEVDFSLYYTECEAFKKTPLYMEFENLIRKFSKNVKASINKSPEFNPSWLQSEWLDIPINDFYNTNEITITLNPILK